MKYTTILLDFDDTLIDTQGSSKQCLEGIYNDYNINQFFQSFEEFSAIYMRFNLQLWDDYAKGIIDKPTLLRERFVRPFKDVEGVGQSLIKTMNDDFMSRIATYMKPIDGAKELLEHLKARYKIVMLSNGFSELQYKKLDQVGFSEYFDEIVLSDVVGVNKPHPDIFTYTLDVARAKPSESIMVGDSYLSDIGGAMKSGIDQLWYNPKNETPEVEPTYTVSDLKEIMNIL